MLLLLVILLFLHNLLSFFWKTLQNCKVSSLVVIYEFNYGTLYASSNFNFKHGKSVIKLTKYQFANRIMWLSSMA